MGIPPPCRALMESLSHTFAIMLMQSRVDAYEPTLL